MNKALEKKLTSRRIAIEEAKKMLGVTTNNVFHIVRMIWKEKHGVDLIDGELHDPLFINKQLQSFTGITIGTVKDNSIKKNKRKNKHKNKGRLSKKGKKQLKLKENFYDSKEWRRVRYQALKLHGRQCLCCGQKAPNVELHVDHIKPRSKYPELELDIDNLQILCKDCNLGKSNTDCIDYRIAKPSL